MRNITIEHFEDIWEIPKDMNKWIVEDKLWLMLPFAFLYSLTFYIVIIMAHIFGFIFLWSFRRRKK